MRWSLERVKGHALALNKVSSFRLGKNCFNFAAYAIANMKISVAFGKALGYEAWKGWVKTF